MDGIFIYQVILVVAYHFIKKTINHKNTFFSIKEKK